MSRPDLHEIAQRASREKAYYDDERHQEQMSYEHSYRSAFAHADQFNLEYPPPKIRKILEEARSARVLELGSSSWVDYLYRHGIHPRELICINVSEQELLKGKHHAQDLGVAATFLLMDAHNLAFPDNSFDFVYGGGILHHLDINRAMPEVLRILRPGGWMLFYEPLAMNPIGNIVRWLTPHRRTPDETPFGFSQILRLRTLAPLDFVCEQLVSVPLSLVSRRIYRSFDNPLMRMSIRTEQLIQQGIPALRYLYRRIIFFGQKRG
jgi:SAM-dependent methyltransferase